jgi:hypothetical protein
VLLNRPPRILKPAYDLTRRRVPEKLTFVLEQPQIAPHDKEVVLASVSPGQIHRKIWGPLVYEEVPVFVELRKPPGILPGGL